VKADLFQKEVFLERVAIAAVKKNKLPGKPQFNQELKNTFFNKFSIYVLMEYGKE
jgi:hypothetical protein